MKDEVNPRLRRWEDRTELPLLVASLVFLAGYAAHVLAPGRGFWPDLGFVAIWGTWLCFVVDFVVRLVMSGMGPLRFVRTHWLDCVVLVLPLLRPLRVVRLYNAMQRRHNEPRLSLHARVITYAGLSSVLLGFAGALTVYQCEHDAPGANILTFGDSVWWVAETLTTVGYGDVTPVTPLGRTVAVGLMACGLALLGAVTGSFSSWLVQVFTRGDEKGGAPEE
ncbi:potassium channel family protein [Streptomyces sp. NPDC048603]|uniref:potassium channel family protein n=1 Tax=Streptomyces sp. NPDC048603 TaxID=3365577 RepID=UPI003710B796